MIQIRIPMMSEPFIGNKLMKLIQLEKSLIICFLALLLGFPSAPHAQKLVQSIQQKSMTEHLQQAAGLRITDQGELLVSSSKDASLLWYQGDKFKKNKLLPKLFEDNEISGIEQLTDGRLVIVNQGSGRIAITDQSFNQTTRPFSQSGDDAGELDDPTAAAVSVNKLIYIADRDNDRISVFDDQGLFIRQFGQLDQASQSLSKPTHVALDAQENVYVLEAGKRNRISIFKANGELVKQLDTQAISKQFGSAIDFSAMTADLNGFLYLADENNKQIFIYDWQRNKLLSKFGTLGLSRGQYRNIAFLSVNVKGQLAVLDKVNAKVEIYQLDKTDFNPPIRSDVIRLSHSAQSDCSSLHAFTDNKVLCIRKDGSGIRVLSEQGEEIAHFSDEIKQARSLHSGPEMVAILENNMLHVYNHDGQKIYSLGRLGTSPGGFDEPSHVFTAFNQIYVADKGNKRIQVFAQDGQFVTQVKASDEHFDSVGPIALDSQQNLYITDQSHKALLRVLDKNFQPLPSINLNQGAVQKIRKIHALDIDLQDRLYVLVTTDVNDYSVRVYQQQRLIQEFGSGGKNNTAAFFQIAGSLSVSSTDKNRIYINDSKQNKQFRFDYLEFPDAAFELRVSANSKRVNLDWNSSKNPIINHYKIEAAASEQGPFKEIASTGALSKSFSTVKTAGLSWFRIVAISGFNLAAKPSLARQNHFIQLQQWYRQERYEDVIRLSEQLLRREPDNADVLHLKAQSLLLSGQLKNAINSFRQLKQYPEYKNIAVRQQVKAYFELEQYLEAKSLIDEVLAQQPEEAYPYLICAELSMRLNDVIGAITCAEDGLTRKPDHARLRFLLGRGYILAGLEEKGLDQFQQVFELFPDDQQIRLQMADVLMQLDNYHQALDYYDAVVSVTPSSGAAVIGKANALLKLDKDKEAKALAIKLSANQQTKGEGYFVLGKISLKQDQFSEAILHLSRTTRLNPENIDAWSSLASAYRRLEQLAKAVAAVQQGIKANPEAFELYQLIGHLNLEQDQFAEAIHYLDKAVNLNPLSVEANILYARALFANRNFRSADIYANKAANIAPNNVDVLTLQANIASQQGKITSAIEYLKTAISRQPDSAELHYQLGRVYQNANLFDNSSENLLKAAAIKPTWAEPHIALGQLYSKRRLFDKAIASFEQALQLEPSDNTRALLNSAFADKKRSLEFTSNAPQLILSDLNLKHLFSAAYKQYLVKPVGSVKVKNVSGIDYGNLQLSFQIKEYMDFPVIQDIPLIKGNESREFEFKATFNNKILEVDEDIGVQVEVRLTFNRDGQRDSIRLTQPMTIYGKNAMLWGDALMVGSFITPKDDTLRNFVRSVINQYQPGFGPLNDKLVAAMTYFSSLTAAGTKYVIDPNTPYTTLRDDQVDYVQFPRETLKLKSGDCDDLSVLLSAGLENLGIETVLVEVPGHLFVMFNTGLAESEASLISQDNSLLVLRNKQVWIPLEATMIQASFNEAWAEGARKYHEAAAQKRLSIIDLRKAWQQYKPVTLGKLSYQIEQPDPEQAQLLIKIAQNQLLSKSIDRLILPYQTIITNNPKNIQARMQIAILYTRYGLYDEAQLAFEALHEIAPDHSGVHSNHGNLYLLTERYDDAIASYRKAAALDERDGGILINLSMAFYRKGDLKQATEYFNQAIRLTPELENQYTAYHKLLNQ